MANGKSKFAGLTELREHQGTGQATEKPGRGALNLPARKPTGKRSNPDWKQKAVLLKIATSKAAEARLRNDHPGTDFSDLVQVLLEEWLVAPS